MSKVTKKLKNENLLAFQLTTKKTLNTNFSRQWKMSFTITQRKFKIPVSLVVIELNSKNRNRLISGVPATFEPTPEVNDSHNLCWLHFYNYFCGWGEMYLDAYQRFNDHLIEYMKR